ncbi:MAG TPA: xanthine phosphoribosyltransferase [Anaerolineae bacterium]|nr:xanthine phosphoribosyltransferase [Anaerolineae bacterium]HID83522.1 xanthine phosphoribosyltransferase [Anaerolineales bacterium]HIQ08803.1 xanthine phosphoribosyltransferase [Anaerolineaceae bacterium]
MKILKERIRREGRHLGRGILKVDSFLNHQVDPHLIMACGAELARRFAHVQATKVLTAEISGITPAFATAYYLHLPMVFARKHKPVTMPDTVFLTLTPSHTKGRTVELMISPEYIHAHDRVLIIDDFLATGETLLGLVRLTEAAGAQVVGIGTVIEKTFEGGRDKLAALGVPVESLAQIAALEGERIVFADEK